MLLFTPGRGTSVAVPLLLGAIGFAAAGSAVLGAEAPLITDLSVEVQDSAYLASFQLLNAFDQDVLDTIESGLPPMRFMRPGPVQMSM